MVDRLFILPALGGLDTISYAICLRCCALTVSRYIGHDISEWDLHFDDSTDSAAAGALPDGFGVAFSAFFVIGVGAALEGAVLVSGALVSVVLGGADGFPGLGSDGAGCIEVTLGELVSLVLNGCAVGRADIPVAVDGGPPGGGGSGAIPRLFLSLAAAAAAAEAYFRTSPAGREGKEAGFIPAITVLPLVTFASGLCSVANVGKGDLSWADGRRAAGATASAGFRIVLGRLDGLGSCSGTSSCTDWLSCDDPRSLSNSRPNASSSSCRSRSSYISSSSMYSSVMPSET